MRSKQDRYDVGVIVGRFQVPELHDAHRAFLEHVISEHDKVIVFLGVAPVLNTRENPLDFESRKQMLLAEYPKLNVLYIKDINSDPVWSRRLDEMIKDIITPSQTVLLYGGRGSFIDRYHGKFPTQELEQEVWTSGNAIRRQIGTRSAKASADFRAGVVWAAYGRYPTAFPTVDVAIWNEDYTKLLLGRKPHEKLLRFIGGFATPESESYEQDARREVQEEAGVAITDPWYIGSFKVDDWRYRPEMDKIKTILFGAKLLSGQPRPGDDIEEIQWVPANVALSEIVETHRPLLQATQAARTRAIRARFIPADNR